MTLDTRAPRHAALPLALTAVALAGLAREAPASPQDLNPAIMSVAEGSDPRGLVANEEGAFDGVTLFSPLNSLDTYLIDMDGEVVHHWRTDSATSSGLYLMDDGTLLRCGREDTEPKFNGGGIAGRIQRLAPDGSIVWSHQLASEDRWQHHDVEPLPNGNLLAISWERIPAERAVALGRHPDHVGTAGLWTDSVQELRPLEGGGAEVVWEWHARDHLVQDLDPKLPGHGSIAEHPGRLDINFDHRDAAPMTAEELAKQAELEEELRALGYVGGEADEEEEEVDRSPYDRSGDWLHTNAVSYLPQHDLIVLSSPELCELLVIDHSTTTAEAAGSTGGRFGKGGEILWRWGNPRNYGHGTDEDKALFYQHDPTWVVGALGDLGLLVFNNGRGRPDGDYSSVEELILPFDPEQGFTREQGQPFGPEGPDWIHAPGNEAFFSAFISGAQRLPNGNTLICSGAPGRIFEVTLAGEVVWDFKNPYGGEIDPPEHAGRAPSKALFRATRLPRDHPGVIALLEE